METIRLHDSGAAVEDVQSKLSALHYLDSDDATGTFDEATVCAVRAFCADAGLEPVGEVNEKVWALLLDASFTMGDRTLFLKMPFFHGNDVQQLQHALSVLGFDTNKVDGIFGAHTENALRKFQMNMGLPSDGIAGAMTFEAINNLSFSWADKAESCHHATGYIGFSRAADVLEGNPLCLFGTDDFTRSVASRMSNLALATSPSSRITSADSLLVTPDSSMLLVHIVVDEPHRDYRVPLVTCEDAETLPLRLRSAIRIAADMHPPRITVKLPGKAWLDAGEGRSAQHYAIMLLDALCVALLEE